MSLIELMVALVILGVLMGVALPEFRVWLWNARIRTAMESLNNGMQLARAEAVRRNTDVQFVLTGADTGWRVGCEIPEADLDGDGKDDCPETIQSRSGGEGSRDVALAVTPADALMVTYNGYGRVTANNDASAAITQLDVDTTHLDPAQSRNLRLLISGSSVRSCDPNVTTAGDPRLC